MLDTVQLYAGLVVLRKTPFALRFLREWLAWATEGELITDAWQPAAPPTLTLTQPNLT